MRPGPQNENRMPPDGDRHPGPQTPGGKGGGEKGGGEKGAKGVGVGVGGGGENTPFPCPLTGVTIDRHNFLEHYEQELRRCLTTDLGASLEGWLEDEIKAMMSRGGKGASLPELRWLKFQPRGN